ncbi:MAG: hypothetical protein ACSLFQ_07900, partial [Thermoanaerobaculia bacterium]
RRDESVPFAGVAETWTRWSTSGRLAPRSRFVEIEEGDHALLEFTDVIANEILALSREGDRQS